MIRYMLDTNIYIYLIKQKPDEVVRRLANTALSEVGIAGMSVTEVKGFGRQ